MEVHSMLMNQGLEIRQWRNKQFEQMNDIAEGRDRLKHVNRHA